MAKASIKMPDEFLKKLSTLEKKTDEIIPKVLGAGGEVVLDKVRDNLSSVIGKESTGELEKSLGLSPAKQDNNGNWNIKIGFNEPRSDGDSNAKIANILEYGKHNQPPRPFLTPAKRQSKEACISAMKAKFDNEVENI